MMISIKSALGLLGALCLLVSIGCGQPRVYVITSTTVGLEATPPLSDGSGTPRVTVGYKRAEVALIPVCHVADYTYSPGWLEWLGRLSDFNPKVEPCQEDKAKQSNPPDSLTTETSTDLKSDPFASSVLSKDAAGQSTRRQDSYSTIGLFRLGLNWFGPAKIEQFLATGQAAVEIQSQADRKKSDVPQKKNGATLADDIQILAIEIQDLIVKVQYLLDPIESDPPSKRPAIEIQKHIAEIQNLTAEIQKQAIAIQNLPNQESQKARSKQKAGNVHARALELQKHAIQIRDLAAEFQDQTAQSKTAEQRSKDATEIKKHIVEIQKQAIDIQQLAIEIRNSVGQKKLNDQTEKKPSAAARDAVKPNDQSPQQDQNDKSSLQNGGAGAQPALPAEPPLLKVPSIPSAQPSQ